MKCKLKISATEGKIYEVISEVIKDYIKNDSNASALERLTKSAVLGTILAPGAILGDDYYNNFLAKHEHEINDTLQDYLEKSDIPCSIELSNIHLNGEIAEADAIVSFSHSTKEVAVLILPLLKECRKNENSVATEILNILEDDTGELIKAALDIIGEYKQEEIAAVLLTRYKYAIMSKINQKLSQSGIKLRVNDLDAEKPLQRPNIPEVSYEYDNGMITINGTSRLYEMEFDAIVLYTIQNEKATVSNFQRNFNLGFNKAANIKDLMIKLGIAEYYKNALTVRAIVTKEQYIAMKKDWF